MVAITTALISLSLSVSAGSYALYEYYEAYHGGMPFRAWPVEVQHAFSKELPALIEKYEADETHGDMNEVLDRWYSSMELPRGWKSRAEYERMALSHSRFVGNKRITETPFVCIDGKRLPDVYDYTELKFLF